MNLPTAQRYAAHISTWIAPYCERLEIAGSIRRQCPECADVDIVCIPKIVVETDMLGAVTARRNLCLEFLHAYLHEHPEAHSLSGGKIDSKQFLIQLPKCQLDLWFADESTWTTRLICRTGSREHNIWICDQAKIKGWHWNPYEGLQDECGRVLATPDEPSFYRHLGIPFIDPVNRSYSWLASNWQSLATTSHEQLATSPSTTDH